MKKLLKKTLSAIVVALFLASCGKVETIQPSPTAEEQSTPTVFPLSTATPATVAQSQARIEIIDYLCKDAKKTTGAEVSPDQKWVAATCESENGKEESPLQVVSIDRSKEWKIYYNDFSKGGPGDSKDGFLPYRWSKDGKHLYAVAVSRHEGCCWTGGRYVLLVQLNLETGKQKELLNATNYGVDLPISFTISEDDHYLLYTPTTKQSYDFSLLDLLSLEKRGVKLNVQKPVDLEYAVMSADNEKIVLPLYRSTDFVYLVDSIILIDLSTGQQTTLISGLGESEELYPIRWLDEEHVLISNMFPGDWIGKPEADYWSLDINTSKRESVEKP